ncbi:MAG: hypothetical protein CBC42_07835 [Betaproteobacteria bacterium TMED82]|nr:MAG: hypothetical protein CBC42_07835 [Betaproteobacteria bacterium TMED82]|tara:strand:+ start:14427 stop:14912 length:486 start_codon:yes stop_codon:yes gene_type:complete
MLLTTIVSAISWSVIPFVKIEIGVPTVCGLHYSSKDPYIELKLEKFVSRKKEVLTSLSVKSPYVLNTKSVYLKTRNLQTNNFLVKQSTIKDQFIAIGDLQNKEEGGLIFYELALFGGELILEGLSDAKTFKLPDRLPRDISSAYLNCAGDLIRPDNEIKKL